MQEWAEGGEWAGHCGIRMMETRRDREISDRFERGGIYLLPPFMTSVSTTACPVERHLRSDYEYVRYIDACTARL